MCFFSLSLSVFLAVRCPTIMAPQHGHMSCDGDLAASNIYPNRCTFTCDDGFRMSGASVISCAASGEWTDQPPTCQGQKKKIIIVCHTINSLHVASCFFIDSGSGTFEICLCFCSSSIYL